MRVCHMSTAALSVDQCEKCNNIANRKTFLGRKRFYLICIFKCKTHHDLRTMPMTLRLYLTILSQATCVCENNNNAISILPAPTLWTCPSFYSDGGVRCALPAPKTISSGKAPIFCGHRVMVPGIHLIGSRVEFKFNRLKIKAALKLILATRKNFIASVWL
jgi:hypothetical protein